MENCGIMPGISFKSLRVYQLAFKLAMDLYYISKKFPREEKYALTNQLRRSSRSVCSNIAEGYRKRQYSAHFIAKISDAEWTASATMTVFQDNTNPIVSSPHNSVLLSRLPAITRLSPAEY